MDLLAFQLRDEGLHSDQELAHRVGLERLGHQL